MQIAAVLKALSTAQRSRAGAEDGSSPGLPFAEILAVETGAAREMNTTKPLAGQKAPAVEPKAAEEPKTVEGETVEEPADVAPVEEGGNELEAEDVEVAGAMTVAVVAVPAKAAPVEEAATVVVEAVQAPVVAMAGEGVQAADGEQGVQVQAQTESATGTDFGAWLMEADVAADGTQDEVKPVEAATAGTAAAAAFLVEEGEAEGDGGVEEVIDASDLIAAAPDADEAVVVELEGIDGADDEGLDLPLDAAPEGAEKSSTQADTRTVQTVVSAAGNAAGGSETVQVEEVVEVRGSPGYLKETVVKSVRLLVGRGEQTLSVRLSPPSLGELQVEVAQGGDGLHVRLMSANASVREALEGQLNGLKDSLARSGISSGSVSVSLDAASAQGGGGQAQRDLREAMVFRGTSAGPGVETAAVAPRQMMAMAGTGTLNVLV